MFEEQSSVRFHVKSYRQHGETRLPKPRELRGIKQSISLPYNPKCKCGVFLHGDDVWVKHGDYFSPSLVKPEDYGMSLNQLCDRYMGKERARKFVYEDAWGDVIARCVAWIKLENLLVDARARVFQLDVVASILRQQEHLHGLDPYELEYTYQGNYMVRFWDSLVRIVYQEVLDSGS